MDAIGYPVDSIRTRSPFLVYDVRTIFSSFCYHIAHILRNKHIPFGDKLQILFPIYEFILYAAALDATCAQKLIPHADAVLKKGQKISGPAPELGVVVSLQTDEHVLFLQLTVRNGRKRV